MYFMLGSSSTQKGKSNQWFRLNTHRFFIYLEIGTPGTWKGHNRSKDISGCLFPIDFLCIYGNGHKDIRGTQVGHVYKRILFVSYRLPMYLRKGHGGQTKDIRGTQQGHKGKQMMSFFHKLDMYFRLMSSQTKKGHKGDISGTSRGHRLKHY